MNYEHHPAADLFPMMSSERLAELSEDIKRNGLRVPVVLCDGKILDGRNRARACKIAAVTPDVVEFTGGNPFEYVWSLNGNRRDLDPGQRAAIRLRADKASEEWLATQRRASGSRRSVAQLRPDPSRDEQSPNLNSQLVRMRPDDILRGLEGTIPALSLIRKRSPFVGYDQIRRGTAGTTPILSMSALLRCWLSSATEVPRNAGVPSQQIATQLTTDEAETLIQFLDAAFGAWGRDQEYARLWGALNLTVCMWMYRRLVISPYSPNTPRLTREQFKKCLMSVSAEADYRDWCVGRLMTERDRAPAYSRLKAIFARRIEADTGSKPRLPQPAWASNVSGHR